MQQDTVMQHSRMFGYRNEELLSVTRFYTTRNIYENLTKITEIDLALREGFENDRFDGICFIKQDECGKIVPCSPEKIRVSNIIMVRPGKRILPIGFTPVAKNDASKITAEVNALLLEFMNPDEKNAKLIPSGSLENLIMKAYSSFHPDKDSARFIPVEKFLSVFRYLTQNSSMAYLIVRRERQISKFKDNGIAYSDAPDTPQVESSIAKSLAKNNPALILIQQNGKALGWNGSPFWWPILVVQQNTPKAVFALDEAVGKINPTKKS